MAVDRTLKEGKGPQFQRFVNDVSSEIDGLESRIAALEAIEDWHSIGVGGNPIFQNGWVNFSSEYNPAGFYKHHGRVYLRGMVKSGSGVIFTLPDGYTPPFKELKDTSANNAYGRVDISVSGDVALILGSNGFVSLDDMSFRIT